MDYLEEFEKSGTIEYKIIWNSIKMRFHKEDENNFEDSDTEIDRIYKYLN